MAGEGALGCEYTPRVSVKVRDPSLVRVEVDDGRGDQTILAPGAQAETTMLPAGHPPFVGIFQTATSFQRVAGGPIAVECTTCNEGRREILSMGGVMVFGDQLLIRELDWSRGEMKIRYRDLQTTEGTSAWFDAAVATPWSNVVQVHRTSTPDRAIGWRLLASAGVAGLLGTFAIIDAVNSKRNTSLALGVPMLVVTVPLLSGAGWYLFAPPREQDLYGGEPGAAR
jgi:hypothetical protein